MASSQQFVEFVCDQIRSCGLVTYRKMFGEYMVYVNTKPLILICNDTPYLKINEVTTKYMANGETGIPYAKAKPHYLLDVDDQILLVKIICELEKITPLPKPKK